MRARDGRSARAHTTAESTDTSPDCTPWLIEGRSAARLTIGRAMPPAATIPAAADVFRNRRGVNGWRMRMLMRSSEAAGEFLASRSRHQVRESLMTGDWLEHLFGWVDHAGVIARPDRAIQYPPAGGYWIARSRRAMTSTEAGRP